jgi:hypothetical protein
MRSGGILTAGRRQPTGVRLPTTCMRLPVLETGISHTLDWAQSHPYSSEAVERIAEELAELTPDR